MASTAAAPSPGYRPRTAGNALKEIVADHLEELLQVYDERFLNTYGPLHRRVKEQMESFLRCGDPHFGFVRLSCGNCGENKILPLSCKTRGLCVSCGQRRALEWAERMVEEVLPEIPYLQLVFTMPKMLRKFFLFDRPLYGELCRVAYDSTRAFFRELFPQVKNPIPAMVASPQSFGNLLLPHSHCHALCSQGVFDREGKFHPAPEDLDYSPLEEIFRVKMLKLMFQRGKIDAERVEMLRSWKNSGFSINSDRRLSQEDRKGIESVLQYMERPPVSLERLTYQDDGRVLYRGKFNPNLRRDYQLLSGVEFLAMLVPHITLRFEVTIRSYGALSTTWRRKFGWMQKPRRAPSPRTSPQGEEEESGFVQARKRNWAKLIQKIWLADPEVCPRCGGKMRVRATISSPAQDDVIEKILRSRGEWDPPWKKARPPRGPPEPTQAPQGTDPHSRARSVEEAEFQQDPPGDWWLN
jgi:hypothetical protein